MKGIPMKLMIAVVQRQDAGDLVDALTARSHRVTRISSEGGFLREGNVTLLIAVEDEHIDAVMRLIHSAPSLTELRLGQ